jgi:hypothetical protein
MHELGELGVHSSVRWNRQPPPTRMLLVCFGMRIRIRMTIQIQSAIDKAAASSEICIRMYIPKSHRTNIIHRSPFDPIQRRRP